MEATEADLLLRDRLTEASREYPNIDLLTLMFLVLTR